MTEWNIQPLVGVGPLTFGMSPEEVETILGPAETTLKIADNFIGLPKLQKKFKHDVAEYRIFGDVTTMQPTVSYRSGKLTNICFEKIHRLLSLDGMLPFETPRKKVIAQLSKRCDRIVMTSNEYTLYFMDVGINMANTKPSRIEPLIAVWVDGLYDDLYDNPDYLVVK
jgi:hypothetical protein